MNINHKNTIKVAKHSKSDRSIKCPQCGSVMVIKEENRSSKRVPPKLWVRIFMSRSLLQSLETLMISLCPILPDTYFFPLTDGRQ